MQGGRMFFFTCLTRMAGKINAVACIKYKNRKDYRLSQINSVPLLKYLKTNGKWNWKNYITAFWRAGV